MKLILRLVLLSAAFLMIQGCLIKPVHHSKEHRGYHGDKASEGKGHHGYKHKHHKADGKDASLKYHHKHDKKAHKK